jgi:hypothetical protein
MRLLKTMSAEQQQQQQQPSSGSSTTPHRRETTVLPECIETLNMGRRKLASSSSAATAAVHREGAGGSDSGQAGHAPPPQPYGSRRTGKQLWARLHQILHDPNNTSGALLGFGRNFLRTRTANDGLSTQERHNRNAARNIKHTCCMYMPDASWMNYWVLTQCVLLFYIAVLVPYRIGFDVDAEPWEFSFIFDIFVDVYFIVDMVLICSTAVLDSEGYLIWRRNGVVKIYLKSWFLVDLLAILPLHYIAYIPGVAGEEVDYSSAAGAAPGVAGGGGAGGGGQAPANKVIRLIRLTKLLKLLRVARLARIMDKYEEQLFHIASSLGIAKIVLLTSAVGHWMCCGWYFAGSVETSDKARDGVTPLEGWVRRPLRPFWRPF